MGNALQLVTLKIENEEYAIDITRVKEIIKTIQITPIPNNISESSDLEGIINLRGAVIPIINLRKKFNMDVINNNDQTRIIVLDMGSQTIGIIVDSVYEVLRVPVESAEEPPPIMKNKQFVSKIVKLGDRLILLLNINNMFGNNIRNNVLMIEE